MASAAAAASYIYVCQHRIKRMNGQRIKLYEVSVRGDEWQNCTVTTKRLEHEHMGWNCVFFIVLHIFGISVVYYYISQTGRHT